MKSLLMRFGLPFTVGGACTPPTPFTAVLTWTLPSALPASTRYWKYGPTPPANPANWYVMPATLAANVFTFSVTDGGLGDDDLTADGTIIDQGGPGTPGVSGVSTPQVIPTLSEKSLILLSVLLALAALAILRRRVG